MSNIHDQEQLAEAMNNAFYIVTGKLTFDNLLSSDNDVVYCAVAPNAMEDKTKFKDVLEKMIEYYITEEQYEKCQMLHDILNK